MAEHFTEDFTLDQLASQVGLSKFHFLRLFKTAAGVSPSHYPINLRMDAARRLLRETKKSVIEVSVSTFPGGAMIHALISRHAFPRLARKQFPPMYRSNPSADVISGIGTRIRMIDGIENGESNSQALAHELHGEVQMVSEPSSAFIST